VAAPHLRPAADGAAAAGCTGRCGMSVPPESTPHCTPLHSFKSVFQAANKFIKSSAARPPAPAAFSPVVQQLEEAVPAAGRDTAGPGHANLTQPLSRLLQLLQAGD
jgi:hypothetical protein